MRDLFSDFMSIVRPFLLLIAMVTFADSLSGSGKAEPIGNEDKQIKEMREAARMRAERVRNKYAGRSPAVELE